MSSTEDDDTQKGGAGKRLDRDLVAEAALRFIDKEGAQGLTMRALAQELGVATMTMYRYVSGREDLLEAVVAKLLEGVQHDLDDDLSGTWQGYLQTLAHAIRKIAVDHAAAFHWSPPATQPPPG